MRNFPTVAAGLGCLGVLWQCQTLLFNERCGSGKVFQFLVLPSQSVPEDDSTLKQCHINANLFGEDLTTQQYFSFKFTIDALQ